MKKYVLLFVLTLLSVAARADDSGDCGENVYYSYNSETHTLTISGTGEMGSWSSWNKAQFAPWRSYSDEIDSLKIESGVISIGSFSFYGCTAMTSVTIANSVISIGSWAFYGCSSLTSLAIPDSLTTIGNSAFQDCSGVSSVAIPNSVTSIGDDAFLGCSGLTSVTIPNSVTSIGSSAFLGCSSLISVTIPNSVSSIDDDTFYNCSGLTSVTIPNSVKSIGNSAFYHCSGLTTVISEIEKPFKIGISVFNGIPSNAELKVPKGTKAAYQTTTGWNVFQNIVETGSVVIQGDNGVNYTIEGDSAVVSLSKTVKGEVKIEESIVFNDTVCQVTAIEDGAFKDNVEITSVKIPNSVKTIGASAFEGCKGITTIIIGKAVKEIANRAFAGISSYSTRTRADGVGIDVYCYADSVPNTNENAFDLTRTESSTLYVPASSVEKYRAAWPWSDFKEIVPMCNTSFSDSGIIYTVNDDGTLKVTGLDDGTTKVNILSAVTIDVNEYQVTSVESHAFEGRNNIEYLSIPVSISSIGENAFLDCDSITVVNISDLEAWCQIALGNEHANPLSIAGKVLVCDTVTEHIDIPETITSIENFAFYQCSSFTELFIPASVKSIASSAFEDCTGLTALSLNDGLESIGDSAFKGCTGLTILTIPATVNEIKQNAFKDCKGMTDVYCYSEDVPMTDENVFDGSPIEMSTLHVSASVVDKYRLALPWSNFKEIVPLGNTSFNANGLIFAFKDDGTLETTGLDDGITKVDILSAVTIDGIEYPVTSIGSHAFEGRNDIEYLSIPESVTSIGENAFFGCGSHLTVNIADLEAWCQIELDNKYASPFSSAVKLLINDVETDQIDIPEDIASIGNFTFYQCPCIKTLTIPAGVKYIGISAFEDCTGLTALSLNDGLESIGDYAFKGCTGLKTLTIPATVNEIKLKAFQNCQGIRDVYCYADTVPNTDENTFDLTPTELSTLHVSASVVDKYRAAWPWSDFKKIVPLSNSSYVGNGIIYVVKDDGTLEVTGLVDGTTIVDIMSAVMIDSTEYQVTTIVAHAFEGRNDIKYLSIPWSIISIGENAFFDCGSNVTVNISDIDSWCQMELGNEHASPLSCAEKLFVRDIETDRLDIPEGVVSIGNFTFYQCRCIKTLTIPSSVKSIASSAFEDCTGLITLSLNEGLESIGDSAFKGCAGMKILTIPATVNEINQNAFKDCMGMTDVYCYAEDVQMTDENAFDGSPIEKSTLHVPASAVDTYRAALPWSGFKEVVSLEGDGIQGIHSSAIKTVYSLRGEKTDYLSKGFNIIRMEDGTVKKVFVK